MDKRLKTPLILVAVAVAAYLGYRWWQNRSSGGGTGTLGTNLNSVAPELIAGSSGPDSGLTQNPPSITVNYPSQITTSANPVANNQTGTPSTSQIEIFHPRIPQPGTGAGAGFPRTAVTS